MARDWQIYVMQPRRGLPASLPAAPRLLHAPANYGVQFNAMPSQGALAAQAVTATLSNPYAQTYSSGYHSSHYAQACLQYSGNGSSWPITNTGGYTLSSTYVPNMPGPSSAGPSQFPRNEHKTNNSGQSRTSHPHNTSSQGGWYQSGNSRCTYKNCTFTGSQKSLETHMMDRHLIYPSGWDHKKRKDWDADPSLKGKPISIQGTTINLDDPEVLDTWIAERKERWPSANRIEDKKRKLDEARARGQISVDDPALLRGKRRKVEGDSKDFRHQERGRGRGRGRDRGRETDNGWRGRGRGRSTVQLKAEVLVASADSDNDAPPEVMTSKAPLALVNHSASSVRDPALEIEIPSQKTEGTYHILADALTSNDSMTRETKPRPIKPKKAPYNPFASRPTLLRNLLLPEIRVTVSNLSQAIRFLVANDFLQGVEMKPGQASQKLIEVIGESTAPTQDKGPDSLVASPLDV